MALKDTVKHMKGLLEAITGDLDKAAGGNKAASQRVRTSTIRLEKVAKMYRKESIAGERGSKPRAKAGKAKKAAPKKAAPKKAAPKKRK
jgi:DNA-binding protein H-NS